MEKINRKKINRKQWFAFRQAGMTYVELIVVLSIFSVMSSVVLFNYSKFQETVNIKVLANDIALKIVEAQKYSIAGTWNVDASVNWKPSYGIHLDISNNKNIIYFTDLDNNAYYEDIGCTGECLSQSSITNGNYISELGLVGEGCPLTLNNLNIVFKRPDSSAIITSNPVLGCNIFYVQLTISSPNLVKAKIKIYPSGRVQIN